MPFLKRKDDSRIIIAGCGRLGADIARALSDAGKSVVVIDRNASSFSRLPASFGGNAVTGDVTDLDVLESAGIGMAASVISVTGNDNTNIMVAQLAKDMYGVKRVISRLYDADRECVYQDMGIETVCPDTLSAREIDKLLEGSGALVKREEE